MKPKMTHASVFTGIGGFDLAAVWMGWENIFQVEIDKYCQKVLIKNFPDVPKYKDIKEFSGNEYAGRIDVLTGGFPCQPFSVAGKRGGSADDRFLWHEMLRVISEVQPCYVLAENVSGLLTQERGMVFEQVCAELEHEGYEVQPFIIPAASVNAPHRRNRIWFIAYSQRNADRRAQRPGNAEAQGIQAIHRAQYRTASELVGTTNAADTGADPNAQSGRGGILPEPSSTQGARGSDDLFGEPNRVYWDAAYTNRHGHGQESQVQARGDEPVSKLEHVTHSPIIGLQGGKLADGSQGTEPVNQFADGFDRKWERGWYEVASEFCGVVNEFSSKLDKLRVANRTDRLKGLGNAIVPSVAYEIFKAIEQMEKEMRK